MLVQCNKLYWRCSLKQSPLMQAAPMECSTKLQTQVGFFTTTGEPEPEPEPGNGGYQFADKAALETAVNLMDWCYQ